VIPGNVHSPKGSLSLSLSLCLFSSSLSLFHNLFLLDGRRKGNFYFVARGILFYLSSVAVHSFHTYVYILLNLCPICPSIVT
jgi:hypothetical protein